MRVVVDEETYWQKNPQLNSHPDNDEAQEYGFPEGSEELVDEDNVPLDSALIRCFPKYSTP